jgi:hypothetical protein
MEQKEIEKLIEIEDMLSDTQYNMQFIMKILSAFLDSGVNAEPSDIYGLLRLCDGVNGRLEESMEKLKFYK